MSQIFTQDMFRGNKIFLIPKNSHAPVVVRRGGFGYPKLEAEGSYNSDSDGENDGIQFYNTSRALLWQS